MAISSTAQQYVLTLSEQTPCPTGTLDKLLKTMQPIQVNEIANSQALVKTITSSVDLDAVRPIFVDTLTDQDWGLMTLEQYERPYKALVMDMDSTLITIECIDELADFVGKKEQVANITIATMRGEIKDFNESLRLRVAELAGAPAHILDEVYEKRLRLSLGAEKLLEKAKSNHIKTLLLSGGFSFFTQKLQARLGLDAVKANQLDIVDGVLTGKVIGEIVNGDVKKRELLAFCQQLEIEPQYAIAMGDGSNDIPMMQAAGLACAHHAKPAVKQHTQICLTQGGLDRLWALLQPSSSLT